MRARTLGRRLTSAFILWALRRAGGRRHCQQVVTFEDRHEFWRYAPFWPDEHVRYYGDGTCKRWNRPPWWRPFNALLHRWNPDKDAREPMHDHPRWTVTVCLRGRIIERTPWGERTLTPGSIVVRSRKAIHSFEVPAGYSGRTWTLFIVGRRDHRQNTYQVTPR